MEAMRLLVGVQFAQIDALFTEPGPVGPLADDVVLHLLVRDDAARLEVDQEHLSGPEPSLVADHGRVDGEDAHFRGHDHAVVVGHVEPTRTQAVAIENRADVMTVGERDGCGTIPGLHETGVVLVKVALLRGHRPVPFPGLRNHHHDRFLKGPAGHQQELQHVVEGPGVGAVGLDDGEELGELILEEIALHDALSRVHPVRVAAQRVDLAVVRHEAVGLRPVPRRKRVRGEPRVHHGEVRGVVGVAEVGEVGKELLRRELSLVDDDLRRQAANVEHLRLIELGSPELRTGALPDHVQLSLESLALQPIRRLDKELLDDRLARLRGRAYVGALGVRRHASPADELLSLICDDGLDRALAMLALAGDLRQEDQARGVLARFRQLDPEILLGDLGQKLVRESRQESSAVAGIGLAPARAPVGHAQQDLVGVIDDLMAPFALDVGHEPDAATVLLVARVVKPLFLRKRAETHLTVCLQIPPLAAQSPSSVKPPARAWPPSNVVYELLGVDSRARPHRETVDIAGRGYSFSEAAQTTAGTRRFRGEIPPSPRTHSCCPGDPGSTSDAETGR